MTWTKLTFGKHKGKTLPQVMFSDPDWFFWAIAEGIFLEKGVIPREEVEEILLKSKSIRIQKDGEVDLEVEYCIHPTSNGIAHVDFVPKSKPRHIGSSATIRDSKVDLSIARQVKVYDKLGNKFVLSALKYHLFSDSGYRLTKKRCESFFDNPDNFDLGDEALS